MPHYEHVLLTRPEISRSQNEAIVKKFQTMIEKAGGAIGRTEFWGLRALAYRMGRARKAHYTLMDISASPETLRELDRLERLDESVIRHMTLRVEQHETGPSAMVARRERDDRRPARFDRSPAASRGDRPKDRRNGAAGVDSPRDT